MTEQVKYHRRVIRIAGWDSPNVQFALAQQKHGLKPTGETLVSGVLGYEEYLRRLETWDQIRICIGIRGEFYEGAEVLLYPPDWLDRAEAVAESLRGRVRKAKGIGIDPGEGESATVMTAVDEWGIVEQKSKKTPDTSVIVPDVMEFMGYHPTVPHDNVCIDRGGGGKQHADILRKKGYKIRTVAFGESLVPDPRKQQFHPYAEKVEEREERYVYVNRRAQMYGDLRRLLDPGLDYFGSGLYPHHLPVNVPVPVGFGIPGRYTELRRQLSMMPLLYDGEGRLKMLPKARRSSNSEEKTLTELLGCSPDEADALVLAVHGLLHKVYRPKVGVG